VGRTAIRLLVFLIFICNALIFPADAETISDADIKTLSRASRLLMQEHKPDEAYRLLAPLEERLAGERRYDYLLGLSALDSGRPELATIALERVLVIDPGFAGARMALARAYFDMGSYENAKMEFEKLRHYHPPPQARAVIQHYLTAIEQRERASRTHVKGYLAIGIGHDSNVNNGPISATISVPALNNQKFILSTTNQKTEDTYGLMEGAVSVTHRIRKGLSLYGTVNANQRALSRHRNFNRSGVNSSVGLVMGNGRDTFRIGGLAGQSYFGGTRLYHNLGFNGSWQHASDRHHIWTLFGQANSIRYNHLSLINNAFDQALVGLSSTITLDNQGSNALVSSLYTGYQRAPHQRADGNKSLLGGNLGAQIGLAEKLSFYSMFGIQLGDYKKKNTAFLKFRRDQLYTAVAGLSWAPAKNLTLKTEIDLTRNDSNIALYRYHRTDVSFTMRQDFN